MNRASREMLPDNTYSMETTREATENIVSASGWKVPYSSSLLTT